METPNPRYAQQGSDGYLPFDRLKNADILPIMVTDYKITDRVKELTAGTDSARKRNFFFSTTVYPQNTASYWSGGSRPYFKVFNMDTRKTIIPPGHTINPMLGTDYYYTLVKGDILIETGILGGKPRNSYLTCLPEDEQRVKNFFGLPVEFRFRDQDLTD